MASKVKFSVSIKELSFSFEGDIETGRAVQQNFENTLNSLARSQSNVLGIEHVDDNKVLDGEVIEASKPSKRRKRSHKPSPSSTEGENSSSSSVTCKQQITGLLDSSFFTSPRTVSEVQKELTKKGFTFKSNAISMALLTLTQSEHLTRDYNAKKTFVYKSVSK